MSLVVQEECLLIWKSCFLFKPTVTKHSNKPSYCKTVHSMFQKTLLLPSFSCWGAILVFVTSLWRPLWIYTVATKLFYWVNCLLFFFWRSSFLLLIPWTKKKEEKKKREIKIKTALQRGLFTAMKCQYCCFQL